jgi:hypothetical protein
MEKIEGTVKSKNGILYIVKWDSETKEAWFRRAHHEEAWLQSCTDVHSIEAAVTCTQRYLDGQPNLY